jgi:predicted DNA-binding transcriptional regulator YafY
MRTATRFPLERIAALDQAIRAGQYPNAKTIGKRLDVCRRTVLRDVEFLRDRLGAPIDFDPIRNGYFYRDPTFRLPTVSMTEGELLALVLAERILRQYRGTPYGPDLARAIKKITEGLNDVLTVDLGLLADSYSFRTTAPESFDPDVFLGLTTAVRQRRRVVIRYWTASRNAETCREVDPYHLACVDGHWYLVAHCCLRGDIRMFAPSRIRSLELTETTFTPPAGFRIEEYLARSFIVLRGVEGEVHRVRLRFTGEAVKYVRERQWHPSQVLEPGSDGGVTVGFELGNLREVERWALSWSPDCEVLEPPELRESIAKALAEAVKLYAPRGDSGTQETHGGGAVEREATAEP